MDYFISDLHFGYEGVVGMEACKKGERRGLYYDTVEEMDKDMIDRINGVVGADDKLFILGDVACYGKAHHAVACLKQLNCKKFYLIKGNHDSEPLEHKSFRYCFREIYDTLLYRNGDKRIFLSHYPICEWDGYNKGIWHFYGHVHDNNTIGSVFADMIPTAVNVSIDRLGRPMTADELISKRQESYILPKESRIKNIILKKPVEIEGRPTLSLAGFKNIGE